MSGTQLPPEVIENILGACCDSPKTLIAACATNWIVRHEAERWLYRSVVLTSTMNTIYFLKALSCSGERHKYVRSLALQCKSTSKNSSDDVANHYDYFGCWEMEWSSFPAAKFLHHLTYTLANLTNFYIDAPVFICLPRNAAFQLQNFKCKFLSKCLGLTAFLISQRSIEKLTLTRRRIEQLELPLAALPQLTTLACTPELFTTLIPGRPVASIAVSEFPDSWDAGLDARRRLLELTKVLATGIRPVESLDWKGAGSDVQLLAALAASAPDLRQLRLEDVLYETNFTLNHFPKPSWAEVLAKFHCLEKLSIYIHFKKHADQNSDDVPALCELETFRGQFLTALAVKCRSLRRVKWMEHPLYWREAEGLPWRQ